MVKIKTLTALMLLLEDLALHGWRMGCWVLGFVGLWLFDLGANIPVFLLFLGGIAYFAWHDLRHIRLPRERAILRRIEMQSGLPHRPLSTRHDTPVNTGEDHPLWQRHKAALEHALKALRLPRPKALLSQRDPYALRLGVLLFMLCGLITAGPQAGARITNGLWPFSFSEVQDESTTPPLTVTITPPSYTREETLVLHGASKTPLDIPEGSRLKIILNQDSKSLFGTTRLYSDTDIFPLGSADGKTYTLDTTVPQGRKLVLSENILTRTTWPYTLIKDTPPVLTITESPKITPQGQLGIPMTLQDDYGVKDLTLQMTLGQSMPHPPLGEAFDETRVVLSPAKTPFAFAPVYDLTAHPWAGLPVILTFTARDDAGHKASSPPLPVILPERHFHNPMAQKLVEIRKALIQSPEGSYDSMALMLDMIGKTIKTEDHDRQTRMGLRAATSRLSYNMPSVKTSQSLLPLLWNTALRLEDGGLDLSARSLEEAQKALERALDDQNTPPEELARLMEDLRQKLAEYMQKLAQAALDKQAPDGTPMMGSEGLSQMLDGMESGALSGDKRTAREMLAQLSRLIEALKSGQLQVIMGQGGQGNRGYDPLGRPDTASGESDVKVPAESEANRIREILEEIRHRASDQTRPPEELEYYRRLLKRF